jgi:hypothetical protein
MDSHSTMSDSSATVVVSSNRSSRIALESIQSARSSQQSRRSNRSNQLDRKDCHDQQDQVGGQGGRRGQGLGQGQGLSQRQGFDQGNFGRPRCAVGEPIPVRPTQRTWCTTFTNPITRWNIPSSTAHCRNCVTTGHWKICTYGLYRNNSPRRRRTTTAMMMIPLRPKRPITGSFTLHTTNWCKSHTVDSSYSTPVSAALSAAAATNARRTAAARS